MVLLLSAPWGAEAAAGPVGITERLGAAIPAVSGFIDHRGRSRGTDEWRGIPVLLIFHYSDCPMLCSLQLRGQSQALAQVALRPGQHFRWQLISLDPAETVERTAATVERYGKAVPGELEAWVGTEAAIRAVTQAVGFQFDRPSPAAEIQHQAMAVAITAEGKVHRYVHGVQPKARDLYFALLDAGARAGWWSEVVAMSIVYQAKGYRLRMGAVAALALLSLGPVLIGAMWLVRRRRGQMVRPMATEGSAKAH